MWWWVVVVVVVVVVVGCAQSNTPRARTHTSCLSQPHLQPTTTYGMPHGGCPSPVLAARLSRSRPGVSTVYRGHNTSSQPMESFSKMLSLATRGEMCMFVCGHFFAAITGCAIPTTLLLLGESFNKFGPGATSDDLLALIKDIVGVMCAIAVGAWITMYLAWMLLSAFGTMVTYRIKQKYLAAILAQECAWFDQTNITELSAKLSRESAAINRAIGEKAGQVTFALALCFSGLVVGLT